LSSKENQHVSVLELDMNALAHNISYFKNKLQPSTKLLAVVKAYAYGHDATQISLVLEKNKVDYLAVAYTHEGISLRKSGIKTPILVLHAQIQNYTLLREHNLEPNLYSHATLNAFIEFADKNKLNNYPVHIKFNTGLNRLGFTPNEVPKLIKTFQENKNLKLQSVFSHLAASEDLNEKEFTLMQIEKFKDIKQNISDAFSHTIDFHLSNTSGIINFPEAEHDMVRLGIGMYGFGNTPKETTKLKNVGSLKTIISQIHIISPGESLGYNRAFIAKKETKTATLPIGHADGISRELGNGKGSVLINDTICPIIGNVCMDMIMVDITNIECNEGDPVFIFKTQEDILNISSMTETISYEILTLISQRIKRSLI